MLITIICLLTLAATYSSSICSGKVLAVEPTQAEFNLAQRFALLNKAYVAALVLTAGFSTEAQASKDPVVVSLATNCIVRDYGDATSVEWIAPAKGDKKAVSESVCDSRVDAYLNSRSEQK